MITRAVVCERCNGTGKVVRYLYGRADEDVCPDCHVPCYCDAPEFQLRCPKHDIAGTEIPEGEER